MKERVRAETTYLGGTLALLEVKHSGFTGEEFVFTGLVGGESASVLESWLRIDDGEPGREVSDASELAVVLAVRLSLFTSSVGSLLRGR